jgi:predicted dehydrogenase
MRIGLVGVSGHYGGALHVVAQHERARLVAVAAAHPEESIAAVRRHPAFGSHTREYDTPEALLNQAELDLLIVNPPYGLNARYTMAALRRGVAVYSEKPLATTLSDLAALQQAVQESGVPLAAMLEMRAEPVIATAARLVREGAIGQPMLAFGQKSYKLGRRPGWYRERQLYGGTIPWVAIHAIDWTRFITGLTVTAVSATGYCTAPELPGVETAGTIQLEFAEGGSAAITYDYLRPLAASTHGDDRFRIAGTDGVLVGSGQENKLTLLSAAGERQIEVLDRPPALFAQFLEALLGECPLPMSAADALCSTAVALWAQQALEKRARLELPA